MRCMRFYFRVSTGKDVDRLRDPRRAGVAAGVTAALARAGRADAGASGSAARRTRSRISDRGVARARKCAASERLHAVSAKGPGAAAGSGAGGDGVAADGEHRVRLLEHLSAQRVLARHAEHQHVVSGMARPSRGVAAARPTHAHGALRGRAARHRGRAQQRARHQEGRQHEHQGKRWRRSRRRQAPLV